MIGDLYQHKFSPWRVVGDKRVVAAEPYWRQPLKWNAEAEAAGERRRVFCASLADVFEDWGSPILDASGATMFQCCQCQHVWSARMSDRDPTKRDCRIICAECRSVGPNEMTMADVRRRLFGVIDRTPSLGWLLLTKRPENIARMMPTYACDCREFWEGHHPECPTRSGRHNVWLGTSVENQEAADERIPHLLNVPASVRFLSCEPLLGPVDLRRCLGGDREAREVQNGWHGIQWVIVGGESGPGARPMHPDWVRSIRDQCAAAGVPFFFKQHGEFIAHSQAMQMEPGRAGPLLDAASRLACMSRGNGEAVRD